MSGLLDHRLTQRSRALVGSFFLLLATAAILATGQRAAADPIQPDFVLDPCIVLVCPEFTETPENPTNQASATFAFDYSGSLWGFKCQLDSAPEFGCGGLGLEPGPVAGLAVSTSWIGFGPTTLTGLSEGEHTFRVTGINYELGDCLAYIGPGQCISHEALRTTDTGTRSFTWRVDLTDPTAQFVGGVAEEGTVTTPSANFEFSLSDEASDVTARCALDLARPVACSSPYELTGFAAGRHEFTVIPFDAAGNSGEPIVRSFTYDPPAAPTGPTGAPASPPATVPPAAGPTPEAAKTKKCARYKKVKLKRKGKVLRTKKGKIRYKRKCVKYKYV